MEQGQILFWLSAVMDSAGRTVEEKTGSGNQSGLSGTQRAKADLLLRQYLYDRLSQEIANAEGIRGEVAEMMCKEIYAALMEEVLYRNPSPEESVELAMFLHACTGGVREFPVFKDLLCKALETDISEEEVRAWMAAADRELDGFTRQSAPESGTREFCGSLGYWSETEAFYQGSLEEALARVLDAAIQTLRQLRDLHERARLHTDVNPENMHLYSDGTVELVNAGTYRKGGCNPGYAAPEKRGERAGSLSPDELIASDLYSWALSILQLTVGDRAWLYGEDVACKWYNKDRDMLEFILVNSRVKKVGLFHQILREYLVDEPERRPHRISDEKVLETMLIKIYEEELHTAYKTGEALETFIRPHASQDR
ncbi:MAG: hypothetical protein Q4F25_05670 [Eubacteriales bacterium]|nr:hypothetical protein [Eubacteriales bacterium]